MPGLDCVSVLECARTRPLEFLASVVSVLEDENSSREQICMAVVVSRSAFPNVSPFAIKKANGAKPIQALEYAGTNKAEDKYFQFSYKEF